MLSIYTYPDNSGTGYIDPLYYGATTIPDETGYYKRISDLKSGAYKPWVTGQTPPVDTVSDLITATGEFHKGVRQSASSLENIQIYSYWHNPLITIDSILINTDITASDTDASPAVRLTVNDSSDLVDGDFVKLTGFDGTLADWNNSSLYADIIDASTVDLYYDSALTDPLKYFSVITGQVVANIDYSSNTPLTTPIKVELTGLGASMDNASISFDTTNGVNVAQDRLAESNPFFIKHDVNNVFKIFPSDANGVSLKIIDFLDDPAFSDNDNYSKFGIEADLDILEFNGSFQYTVDGQTQSNKMYKYQMKRYNPDPSTPEGEYDSTLNLANWYTDDIFTPQSNGNTGIDANLGFKKTKYHWGASPTNQDSIGYGFQNVVEFSDTGIEEPPLSGNYWPLNQAPKQNSFTLQPKVTTNGDGLAYSDGGQAQVSNFANIWWNRENNWYERLQQHPDYTGFAYQGKTWTTTSGRVSGYYNATTATGYTPFTASPTYLNASEIAGNFGQFLATNVIWNPNSTTDMFPDAMEISFDTGVGSNISYVPPMPSVYSELEDIWNGNSTQKGIYCDLAAGEMGAGFEMILVPVDRKVWFTRTVYSNNQPPVDFPQYTYTVVMFDPRIWDVDYGKRAWPGLPYAYPRQWENASGVNFEATPWITFHFPPTQTSWNNSSLLSLFSGRQTPGGESFQYLNDYELTQGLDLISNQITGSGTQLIINSTQPAFDKLRTGTILQVTTGQHQYVLKLKTASPTQKIFTGHPLITAGPSGIQAGAAFPDFRNPAVFTTSMRQLIYSRYATYFPVNTFNPTWFHTTTNTQTYQQTPKIRYYEMKDTQAGTTATVGANIVDSTTGNIELNGAYNHKADNPHVYFPSDQTYQRLTQVQGQYFNYLAYVNGAILGDDYYEIDSATVNKFNIGTGAVKPGVAIAQTTQGYINGVGLTSTGRITSGKKMLTIDTAPDTYVPPTPTPAEAEDIWDTEDQWASDGYANGLKQWPDHVTPMSAEINYNSPTITNNSQSGIKYTRSAGHTKWQLDVVYPPMSAADFKEFNAIAQAAHGQSTPFYFNLKGKNGERILWKDFYNQNNTTTTPRVKDDIVAGDTLALFEGFSSNEPNAFMQGEVFIDGENENGNLHTALSGTAANVYGEAKIRTPWPFRSAQSAGQQVYKDPQHAVVTLGDDNFTYSVDVNNYYYVSVSFDLDSWK